MCIAQYRSPLFRISSELNTGDVEKWVMDRVDRIGNLRGKVVDGMVHMERDSSAFPTAAYLLLRKEER